MELMSGGQFRHRFPGISIAVLLKRMCYACSNNPVKEIRKGEEK